MMIAAAEHKVEILIEFQTHTNCAEMILHLK